MAKWRTLEHNGVLFSPEYEPKGLDVSIKGKKLKLAPLQEEMAYHWAKKKDTPYAQDRVFRDNFVRDFAKALGSGHKGLAYSDIDFGRFYRLVDEEKAARESMTPEQRKALAASRKEARESLKAKYGTARIDGKPVELGNYMVEPPGIFIGRGAHPMRGRWKPRIGQKDVTLNLSRGAKAPPGRWAGVSSETDSVWVAKWSDKLTGNTKYIWLADTAELKQDMDRAKYDKAVRLSDSISEVVDSIVSDMGGDDPQKARIATACYLIYRTSMRVGDEKDPDEADTVGATTLRREHVRVTADSVEFDFLGKDSVRWQETVKATGRDEQFRRNMAELAGGPRDSKLAKQEIFDGISSRHVNAYYSGIMKGLSAKVFRTYLASREVAGYLREHDGISGLSPAAKLYHAKMANLKAAVMCNHKRTVPKTFKNSLAKRRESLRAAREAARKIRGEARSARSAAPKAVLDAEEAVKSCRADLRKARAAAAKKASKPGRAKVKRLEAQLGSRRARLKKRKEQAARRADRLDAQAGRREARAEKLRLEVDFAGRTRDYNIGTSLRNYIDPRVFRSWMDEVGGEWSKLYTASLARKFRWAEGAGGDWKSVSSWY